jgi:hypothetical protein
VKTFTGKHKKHNFGNKQLGITEEENTTLVIENH